MYLGQIVEIAERDELFRNPRHPYTQALLNAVPVPDPALEATRPRQLLIGEVPSVTNPPQRVPFPPTLPQGFASDVAPRAPLLKAPAEYRRPRTGPTRVACHLYDD